MRHTVTIIAICLLAACAEEPPPRSVQEFVDNEILLEAAMVRCAANRVETRYEAECVNAREAVKIIAAREEDERQARMEALSEQKRRALRRTLDAKAEARKRAAEQKRLREEAAYLAQFGELPPSAEDREETADGNAPTLEVPAASSQDQSGDAVGGQMSVQPPSDGGNAPGVQVAPKEESAPSELSEIREELKNRQQ